MPNYSHREDAWLDVWGCDHLWEQYHRGDVAASNLLAEVAFDLMIDMGENVAVCHACGAAPQHVPMTLRQVQFGHPDNQEELVAAQPYESHMVIFADREPSRD